ncbi:MAG: DUF3467 domain-containing protein [Anaerolineae bacterium]
MSAEPSQDGMMLSLKFCDPEGMVSRYATNLVVQHTEHEFILSFYEAEQPLLLGTPEENKTYLEDMGHVRATCVSRVIVAAGRMKEFMRVLQENHAAYEEKSEKKP